MKHMIRILSVGLLLSISSVALAGQGKGHSDHDGYHGDFDRQHHSARYNDHHNDRADRRHHSKHDRHNRRHYVENKRHAPRHTHQGHYCYDWHPRAYVAPRVRYGYGNPNLVIVYHPGAGLYIRGGH